MKWFISRHKGAKAWAHANQLGIDHFVEHIEVEQVQSGDEVYGTLPVHLAGEVCCKGARYFHLQLDVPAHYRGHELTAEQMDQFGAVLEEYQVRRAGN